MQPKVAVVRFDKDIEQTLADAYALIGGIDDLNNADTDVTLKVGVFDPASRMHTSVPVLRALLKSFETSRRISVVESDNYRGKGRDRLEIWRSLYDQRIQPVSLSEPQATRSVTVTGEELRFPEILFKPRVFVSTHILRVFDRGSVLKNLLGLVPDARKVRFHKRLPEALADIYKAVGGIDLAVLDGSFLWQGSTAASPPQANVLVVGRDAVAVEAVGLYLCGMAPERLSLIQEFVKRGLGEGSIERIDVQGLPLTELRQEFAKLITGRMRLKGPQTWSAKTRKALKELRDQGFFNLPAKRSLTEIAAALESRSIAVKGREASLSRLLDRSVKHGELRTDEGHSSYWKE